LKSDPIHRSGDYYFGHLMTREEFAASDRDKVLLEVHPNQQTFVLYRTGEVRTYDSKIGDVFIY